MREIFVPENNPYTLQFSFVPPQFIDRKNLTDEIIMEICKELPTFRGHFLTGVRGCGKTVMMTDIANKISKKQNWITVDIEDPTINILAQLAHALYRNPYLQSLFIEAKMDFSVLGIGISIEKAKTIVADERDAVHLMLQTLKDNNIKLLVTIDEVTYCNEIKSFSHTLSSYARSGFDIYVLMTGLRENILAIKNDKSLTFLYRAKENILQPLNITAIRTHYENVFGVSRDEAEEMAWLTKGYSFAFQLLGYLYWEAYCEFPKGNINIDEIMNRYDRFLSEFSYDKIWSELPPMEKRVIKAIASCDTNDVKDIRAKLEMNSSNFSVHRSRLIDRGLIDGTDYGKIKFVLPRFAEIARGYRL